MISIKKTIKKLSRELKMNIKLNDKTMEERNLFLDENIIELDEQVKKEDKIKHLENIKKLNRLEFAYKNIKNIEKNFQLKIQILQIKYYIYEYIETYEILNETEKIEYSKTKRDLGMLEYILFNL